ncbi:MAG: hypothetical protein ABI824_05150 [Acidobacteriota bacterium]
MPIDNPELEGKQEDTYRKRVLKTYFVRFHMGLILTSVIATGVLGSRFLLLHGVHSMPLRYGIAVLLSYGVFLVLVRIWIWWVTSAKLALDLSLLNGTNGSSGGFFGGSSSGSGIGDAVSFGGGSSGGGGASGAWDSDEFVGSGSPAQASLLNTGTGGSQLSGSWLPGLPDLPDIDGDDWWILLLLVLLVGAILGSGGYLIYAAPQILPEAAWQAALAGGLHRMTKQKPDWKMSVLRSSAIPFAVVLTLAGVLGWQAQRKCPSASRLMEVFSCSTEVPAP